jgi:cobalt-zinc-cadmium efflux system outer membrane protein
VSLLERIWQAGEMSTADYLVQLNQTLDTRTNALEVQGRLWTAWADWLVASGQADAWLGQSKAQ